MIQKVGWPMGAGNLRELVGCGVIAAGVVALACGCTSASSSSLPPGATPPPATPTMTPTAVPVLGKLTLGTFPGTADGMKALDLCEQWAQLRAQYVTMVKASTPRQLVVWFSGPLWNGAYADETHLKLDPNFGNISLAFGLATVADEASIASAGLLDRACSSAN
jgi:hypothetical protein